MTPDLALNLSHEGVALLARAGAKGWVLLGNVSLDDPQFATKLTALRDAAIARGGPEFVTKLVIPNTEILYTRLSVGPARGDRAEAIRAALDGLTPYRPDELAFDWRDRGSDVDVAVVALETLDEAQEFAVQNGFRPVAFVAIPPEGAFEGEPFLGRAPTADDYLGKGTEVTADREPIRIIPAAAEAEPDTEAAPTKARKARAPESGTATETPATPTPAKVESGRKRGAESEAGAPARTPTVPPAPPEGQAPEPAFRSVRAAAKKPVEVEPERLAQTLAARPRRLQIGGATEPGDSAVAAAESGPLPLTEKVGVGREEGAQAGSIARALTGAVPSAARAATAAPGDTASFGLPGDAVADTGRNRLLLVIIAGVIALAAIIAIWALARMPDVRSMAPLDKSSEPGVETAIAVPVPSTPAADRPEDGKPTAPALPPVAAVRPAGKTPRLLAPERAVPPADGPGGALPEPPRAQAAGPGALRATDPSERADAAPMAPATVATAPEHAAASAMAGPDTGDRLPSVDTAVPVAPTPSGPPVAATVAPSRRPTAPAVDTLDGIRVAVAEPFQTGDAPDVLGDLPPEADAAPRHQGVPAPAGTRYLLDARGLIVPTAEGVVTPDGVRLVAGRPDRVPPLRPGSGIVAEGPDSSDEVAAPEVDVAWLAAVARATPRLRPEALTTTTETAAEAPETPSSATEVPDEDTELALGTSPKPKLRPAGILRVVKLGSLPASAAPSAKSVAPPLPTKASVARRATVEGALDLGALSLIGIFGQPDNRRAAVRTPTGRILKIKVGDRLDGGEVTAIGDDELRYRKGSRDLVLKMPKLR